MESILITIKKLIGIDEDCRDFDIDIITDINTALIILNQMGVGSDVFTITGDNETWSDYLGDDLKYLNLIKTYIYQKVRLMFDPPAGAVAEAMNNVISELEWRINSISDEGLKGE